MSDKTIQGFEADPADVEALLRGILAEIDEPDPQIRYVMLSKEVVLYDALVSRLADERARAVAEMSEGGLSYEKIAHALNLGSRSRAQQLVERGRALAKR